MKQKSFVLSAVALSMVCGSWVANAGVGRVHLLSVKSGLLYTAVDDCVNNNRSTQLCITRDPALIAQYSTLLSSAFYSRRPVQIICDTNFNITTVSVPDAANENLVNYFCPLQ